MIINNNTIIETSFVWYECINIFSIRTNIIKLNANIYNNFPLHLKIFNYECYVDFNSFSSSIPKLPKYVRMLMTFFQFNNSQGWLKMLINIYHDNASVKKIILV